MPIMFKKMCSLFMIVSLLMISLPMPQAYAAMVATEQVVQTQSAEHERNQILVFMEQAEVQQQLQNLGVDTDEASLRVANMTDAEAHMLAGKIDQLPTGSGAVSTLITALLVIFLVLLLTDIIGLTDVFPFVNSR